MGARTEDLLIRIVLNGLKGDLLMPPMGTLDDQQLAGILTYVRGVPGDIRPDRFRPKPWRGFAQAQRTSGAVDGERAFGAARP